MAQRHVLKATDNAIRAFLISEGVLEADKIVRFKEVGELGYPFLVVASLSAERTRAKNWKVTGSIILRTSALVSGSIGEPSDKLDESDQLETDLLEALEQYIPADDSPQNLAEAIQAAAVDATAVAATEYLMTAFYINKVDTDVDDDGSWTYSVDFTAAVVA